MASAQVLPAFAGALIGAFPGGFALFHAINTITGLLYEPLITFNPLTLTYLPVLATHWKVDPDGQTYWYRLDPDAFEWREKPYEFVSDRPAIDLLTGGPECREAIESGEGLQDWMAGWAADEREFREERRGILLYPEETA